MSGRFIPRVQFDFPAEDCKSSWVQIEPIFCVMGYGIKVKIILRQVSGTGDKKYEYDRTIHEEILTQSSLPQGAFNETTYEYLEGFYYNKITQDVVVPLTAMVLNVYFPDIVENCQLDLSGYFLDVKKSKKKTIGYLKD